jgi:hypothetical protein
MSGAIGKTPHRPLRGATPTNETALVKCASHRARRKMLTLVGEERAQALYSLHRETGKGVYRIPAELAPEAKQITGVSGFRDGPDMNPCWPSTPLRDLIARSPS